MANSMRKKEIRGIMKTWLRDPTMDEGDFISRASKIHDPETVKTLIGYRRSGPTSIHQGDYDRYRARREMEMKARRAQNSPVNPGEYNAMAY